MKLEFTKKNINDINAIYNKLKLIYDDCDYENYEFMNKYHDKILNLFEDMTNGRKSDIASLLYKFFYLRKNNALSVEYQKKFKEFSKLVRIQQLKNIGLKTIEETEGWITQEELKKKIDILYENRLTDINKNYEYLLLCIHYYNPMRTQIYQDLLCLKNKSYFKILNRYKKNYLYYKNNEMILYINSDKVSSNAYHSNKIIMNKELAEIIRESLKHFPRTHLFGIANNYELIQILRTATDNKKTNNRILRKSFESQKVKDFKEGKINGIELIESCKQQRHTLETVLTHYDKL